MDLRVSGFVARVIAFLLLLAGGLAAQTVQNSTALTDADNATEGLRQISREVTEAVRRFHSHLDEAVGRYDSGYRGTDGRQIPGADVGLIGAADVTQKTIRKFAAFRMLAARNQKYEPLPVADMDQIQNLIAETHERVSASTRTLQRLLVVSVKDIGPHRDIEMKTRHAQLLKARATAEDAAKQAWLSLPINLSGAGTDEENGQKAWDLLSRGWTNGVRTAQTAPSSVPGRKLSDPAAAIPIRIERRRRFTLIDEASYRMALTDAGIEDASGRRLFYQEEWVQRGASVIRLRWRVAVDTLTGEHVLVKRYPTLELHGELDDLYKAMDRYSVWYLEPADETIQASPADVESALAELEDARVALRAAVDDFQNTTRASLARHDQGRTAAGEPLLDAGLTGSIRETLFAIRAHLAGVSASIDAESRVWQAITVAASKVANLESVAAWANHIPEELLAAASSAAEWERLLERSDHEIDLVRTAEIEGAASVPPGSSQQEAKFPALQRGVIVRIRRPSAPNLQKGLILCRQETWHMESPMPGSHEVRRTVTLVAVDPRTGAQTPVGTRTKYYPADAADLLEQIFDQHAADELPVGVLRD